MADDIPLPPLGPVLDWPKVTPPRPEDTVEALYRAASHRLHHDPLLAARAKLAARIIETQTAQALGVGYDALGVVRRVADIAAAVALLIAERPELITGEPPRRRPPVDVLTRMLDPLVRVYGFTPVTDGHLEAQKLARSLLQALELDGYEVAVRADRFATLPDDGRRLRIPLRGRCGICLGPVERQVDGTVGELLIGPWRHPGEVPGDGGGHEAALVDPL